MLYLWMPEGQGQWQWQLEDGQWHSADSLEQLIQVVQVHDQGQDAVVFFPHQSAQFFTQSLPRAKYKQLGQQGVQYLLEEYSIEPVEQLAIFHDYHDEHINFMAMSQSIRETYQQSLALLPWHIQALLPDFLLVPEPEKDSLNIVQIGQRRLMRWSALRGWSLDDMSLLAQLKASFQMVNFYQCDETSVQAVQAQLGQSVEYRQCELEQVKFPRFRQHPFNALLKTKRKANTGVSYWKACAAILCLAIVVQVVFDGLRWWKYQSLANQTAQLAVEQYQQWYPNERHINEQNLKKNFKAKLAMNATADRQALQLISRAGAVLQQNNIAAEQVLYQNNVLSLNLLARNSDAMNQLTEQLKQQGLNVELGAMRNQGTQVIGLVKVQ
ncbi:MAG: general secretion pathway protein GspL [Acinetobacter sp.]|nr:MAG: general secretion pathway protein GspL [Acinetobacter sp.]